MPTQPLPKYFGGDASNLGIVRALDSRNFKELVESCLNVASVLNVTRAEFEKADKKTRNEIKKSPYLTPCTFVSSPAKRLYENAESISLICLDIDNPSQARGYYNDPVLLAEQLDPFNFALYSTASSTPAEPRIRIIVEASGLSLSAYQASLETIASMIGLADITTESRVQVQPMYLPIIFKGDDPDLEHPLIHFKHSGCAFAESDIVSVTSETRPGKKTAGRSEFSDAIEFLKAPVEGITIETAKQALSYIDPDLPYSEWFKICLALRHQFWGSDEDSGYEVFDRWSSKGAKYAGPDDTQAKWISCDPHAKARFPVTIRTILRSAHDAGWDSSDVIQSCFDKTHDWLVGCETPRKLISQGIGMIATTPLQSATEEEFLLNVIVQRLKTLDYKVGLTTLRNELKKTKAITEFKNSKKKDAHPVWSKGLIYIGSSNEFYRHATREKLSPEALDNTYSRLLMDAEAAEGVGAKSRPEERPRDLLLNVIQIPTAHDYLYDPRKPNDTIITKEGRRLVNTYVRGHPEPDFDRADEAGVQIEKHATNLIAEPEYRETFLDYLAYLVQKPGKKIRWAPLIQGGHGCGKSFFFEMMKVALGSGNVSEVPAATLTESQWNDWAEDSQFVAFEEIRVVGKNRYAIMDKLKPLVSNDTVSISRRFRDVRTIENITNYVAFTNFRDAAALTEGDRRWFIIFSPYQTKQDVERLNAEESGKYFRNLFSVLTKNPGGVRAYLERRQISSKFEPSGHAPRTHYFDDMLSVTEYDDAAFLNQFLEESENLMANKWFVSVKDLQAILDFEGLDIKAQRIANLLINFGMRKIGRTNTHDGVKRTFYAAKEMADLGDKDAFAIVHSVDKGELSLSELNFMF